MACTTGIAGRNALAWANKLKAEFLKLLLTGGMSGRKLNTGQPLDETTRVEMESVLGYDLQDVRIHKTKQAGELARRLEAEAFTIGTDIFAAEERLNTTTEEGKGLMAHELTHVVQQTHPKYTLPNPDATQQAWRENIGQRFPLTIDRTDLSFVPVPQLALPSSFPVGSSEPGTMEAEAENAEQAVQHTKNNATSKQSAVIDAAEIADSVYRLMQQELLLENDRMRR